ncbi:YheC/YheD family protein [Paenibacillus qinlingensis]|uniref:Glutathione synthase/RimK-type ligase-like ATP-grasp enzyme n=1 Tax=Paenibacillus qinlingensis TaxID=1837343 RepID=A0ABU1NP90_9BACL|nr:YheC/YheD family protein [Paenibacillus qinlingensis]MDR6549288.1 glutathione synthase/RimK-type ligase-like ATP-grasp enzyme [Paenibacillus qinlingensis]
MSKSHLSTSKWTKYKLLRKSKKLQAALPETDWLSVSSFWRMLPKYGQLILKPTGSYGGSGVLQVKTSGNSAYEVQDGAKHRTYHDPEDLNAFIKKKANKNYIVQQRIHLATKNGRPFDLRVMVQRHSKSPWQVTGMLAKVAGKGYIITNIRRSGGRVVTVESALRGSELKDMPTSELLAELHNVALRSAEQLGPSYRWVKTMGIDMAFDKQGNVWIIEVNFAPMLELFLRLPTKTAFHKIKSFHVRRKQP